MVDDFSETGEVHKFGAAGQEKHGGQDEACGKE